MSAGQAAAERILAEKGVLAREITDALYALRPELQERYGDYGRGKCLEDMQYNLEHLAPAVDLGEPGMFAGYVRWLDGLLRARRVDSRDIVDSLRLIDERLRARFTADEHAAVEPSIRAGLAVLESTPEEG